MSNNGKPLVKRQKLSARNIGMKSTNTGNKKIKRQKKQTKKILHLLIETIKWTPFTTRCIGARIKSIRLTVQSTTKHALSQIDSLRIRKGLLPEETASWCANAKAS